MKFEWDQDKYNSNIEKHKIDFEDATIIFDGETVEQIDEREDYGEERIIAVGKVDKLFLTVIYTVRDDFIRIISARKASKNERKSYVSKIGGSQKRQN